ncbi:MAG: glycerol kinase, partial [Clostridia bacterium]|nr:glycerol kinase [Clostridia bacterium]
VWQCRRTAELCEELKRASKTEMIHEKTGLVVDAYFSGTKLKWMLDHIQDGYGRAKRGELMFGTVDAWLIYKLTGGKCHATDVTNASRTMLFNIHTLQWDEELLAMLDIPKEVLPKVVMSSGHIADCDASLLGAPIPIAGCAGDQHAALFGQTCFKKGEAKNTYGTGCFLLMNTGAIARSSDHGLLTTIAWGIDGKIDYALEGSIFVGGAVVQWLRDELKLIENAAQSQALAESVPDTGGVVLVPAFTGMGAPYWDMYARGTMLGVTRGTSAAHVVRAALESIAQQSADVLHAMESDSGETLGRLLVDGGASANDFLMQYQADILGTTVTRPRCVETTALGAAYLAGLAVGVWKDKEEIARLHSIDVEFRSTKDDYWRQDKRAYWKRAVDTARFWASK